MIVVSIINGFYVVERNNNGKQCWPLETGNECGVQEVKMHKLIAGPGRNSL